MNKLTIRIDTHETTFHMSDGSTFVAPIGDVRLTQHDLVTDPPRAEELSNAIGLVQDHVDDLLREMPSVRDSREVVGAGSVFTSMAAVEVGAPLTEPFTLTRSAAEDVYRTLATERLAERVHNPGLPESHADTIVGGCCIVVAILRKLQLSEILVEAAP